MKRFTNPIQKTFKKIYGKYRDEESDLSSSFDDDDDDNLDADAK